MKFLKSQDIFFIFHPFLNLLILVPVFMFCFFTNPILLELFFIRFILPSFFFQKDGILQGTFFVRRSFFRIPSI